MLLILKFFYWTLIGWWFEPILLIRRAKIQKMQNEITKHEYEKIQQEKKEEI